MSRDRGHENIDQLRDTVNSGTTNKHTFSGSSGLISVPAKYVKIIHKGTNVQSLKVKVNLDEDTIGTSYTVLEHKNNAENCLEIDSDIYNVTVEPVGAYNVPYEIVYRW